MTSSDGFKPTFLEKPIIKQSNDFKHVQFDCRFTANPKPTIQWLHKGEPINESSTSIETLLIPVKSSSSASSSSSSSAVQQQEHVYLATLILKEVDSSRTGDYKCLAKNKFGESFASINLNFVQGKSKQPADGRAPKFPVKPSIKQIGQSLKIECVVEANPKPIITWYHDHVKTIKEDSKHSHLTWHSRGPIKDESELRALGLSLDSEVDNFPANNRSSFSSSRRSSTASQSGSSQKRGDIYVVSLEIKSPKATDGGTYRCNAVNDLGESSANIALNFQTLDKQKEEIVKTKEEVKKRTSSEENKENSLESSAAALRAKRKSSATEDQLTASQLRKDSTASTTSVSSEAVKQQKLRQSAAESAASSRKGSTSSVLSTATGKRNSEAEVPMEVDDNRLSSRLSAAAQEQAALDQEALDKLPPVKRTSSTSSTKRTISVKKKKRPSLIGPDGLPVDGEPAAADESSDGKPRVVKKRVSVKREAASNLKDIAEQEVETASKDSPTIRRDSASSVSSLAKQQQLSSSSATRNNRIPSVSIEAPKVIEPEPESGLSSSRRRSGQAARPEAPRFSVSDTSLDEPQRGSYEGLRAEPASEELNDQEAEEERKRYLASRGGSGTSPRESLSPSGRLNPMQRDGSPQSGSVSPQRQGSQDGSPRRGSILLMPDGNLDSRRPSIIIAEDNKLRPGEIADRRRRSSIDIRRASAIEVEAADRPSTPLKAVGKKAAIVDFQDNISGTENHTSYLTFGVEGDPVPTLRFFKGDSEIYEGGRYSIVTDGDTNTVHFCIRKSKPMDEARYKVMAINEHGEDTAYMQLFVSDESGMDFRAMLKHRQYAKWKKDQDDPNWGNLKAVEEERLAQIKEPKRPDNFIKPLQNIKVKQGKDLKVRFECVFSKSGVKAKWFRNNKEIFPNKKFHLNSTGDLHVLEIESPFVEDGGKFTCQCLDTKCSAMLEVEEPDPVYKFTKLLNKAYGQYLNRELVLECTCNSHRAQVNWYKNDPDCKKEPLSAASDPSKFSFELDKFGKKILRIKYCTFEDSGTYTCKIMNTPRLDEVTTAQVQISEKKFQIMKPLYSQRATEDDKIILECEVDEYDAPVKWFRKDRETGKWKELKPEQLKHKEIVVDGKKRRLIIKKAKCQDEGEYKCCTNADETACELFVEPSNKWRKKLQDITVIEDEPLVLEVELMERKPGMALVWSRNGKEVGCQGGAMQTTADERVNFKIIEDKQQLIIERAKLSDAGDWSVMFNKMKCNCKVQVLPAEKAPTIKFPQNIIQAEVGKPMQVEIPYQVGGTKQSPVIPKLMCNGQPVPKDKVELIVKDDNKIIMKFKDPQRSDCNENYEFVLENAKGKQGQKFKLDVQGPPGTPEGPLRISDVFKDKCKLSWERPLDDGGSPIAHYVVERQEVGSGRTTWQECGITSTTDLDVKDLSKGKEYKFRVRAVNKKGKSEPLVASKSILAKDPYDPPSEPENLELINWDKDFVDLQWEAPAKDGGIPIEKYVIEGKSKFATDWTPIKEQSAGQGCKAHVTETLKEGAQMQFRVRAANKMGWGEPSKATKPVLIKARFVKPYIAGDGLKNIVVKKGRPVRYDISFNAEPAPEIIWIANDQELREITDKCEIERGEKKTSLNIMNTTRADSGRYKLKLKNSCGEIVSEADVVVLDRPSAPEGPLVVEEIKADQVTIKWRKPKDTGGEDIDGYVVEKMNMETGRWVPAGECGPRDEMFTVTNLMKGKKYKFRVRAKNKEGESEPLETNNVLNVGEEPTISKCPSKVTVGQGETAKVKIHFQGDPSEFEVVNMDTGEVIGEGQSAGIDQPKYTVFDDYLTVTIPNAKKGKSNGRYKVKLKNKIGSNEAHFDLDVSGPPSAPQGPMEISDVTENSANISWRPPADDGGNKVSHYIVERRCVSDDGSANEDAWIEVSQNCKDTNFNVTGLTKDKKYEFRVMAVNDNGQSKPLVCENAVMAKLPYDPPSPPGKPEATPVSEDSIQLEWEKPKSDGGSRISGYLIEKREVGSDTWQKVNQPDKPCLTNEFTVKNLIEGRKYEFRVIAQNAAGLSNPSECSGEILCQDPNASDVPKFIKPLKKKVIGTENNSFELECIVQGNPPPTVVWSKGNKDLRDGCNNGKYCMTQESGPNGTTIHRLLVSRAAGEDADEYSIKATNKAGSRTSRCDVEIQTKPKIKVPPQYQCLNEEDGSLSALAFDRGESVQLKIPFTGNPPPKVQWFKGDEEIEPGAQFDIESDDRHTILTIRDATREDSGEYRLVVSNALGQDSASFNVSVSDRPEPPRFPQLEEIMDESVTIKFKEPLWDGGSQITGYVIEKRELPMTSWIRAGTTRFLSHQVINLNEEKDYEFRVFAENIYGRSDPSETIKCTTKPLFGKNKKQKTEWPIDPNTGKKIRSQNGNEIPDDYDRFVKDGPVNHMAADIKTCPITDNYEILEKIGEGIFGEVYRVREKATGDYYAAKFVPVQSQEEKNLLKKEIDVNNLLHHKNILRLHDAYEDDDEMVTVHEFISGKEVFEKICEPGYQMTEEQVRKYMRDVCEAVRHMHDRNVIHLDLKPENLVLQSKNPLSVGHEPKVKIVDFGLACKLDPHEMCKISTMAADYAAPEILEKDSVGFYTDMWAIGVLTYVLMSGQTPFGSHADIKAGQWSFTDNPIFEKISPEGKDFIEKLLVKQKEKRMTAHECLEHPWLKEDGDEETRQKRRQVLNDDSTYRRQRDMMKNRYLNWWDKSILSIGHISNYGPLRKLYADRYHIHDALLDRRELAPRFTIKPQSTFAYEGQSAKFYCLISSDSPVTVSWSKDNKELKQSVKYMKRYGIDNKEFNFVINRCKLSDFGEYFIRAENHHGWREEPVFLDVRKRPVDFTPVHLEPMKRRREPEPPKFEEEPDCPPKFNFMLRPRIIQSGLSVKLLCCLKGKPAPTITWFKDGKELSKKDYTMKHADGVCTLEIASCDTSHTGKYTCHAENPLGEDKTIADVLIEGKRTFTPSPIAGYLSNNYSASSTSYVYSGRHHRSASLSRSRDSSPLLGSGLSSHIPHIRLSPTIQGANLNLPTGRSVDNSRYLSAKLYSPNYSMNTNRYLRRSYKAGPAPSSATSATSSSSMQHTRTYSRFSNSSRIPISLKYPVRRSLSTYGRSSSSLQ